MKYFGTDGIRQKAEAFTPEFVNSIVAGLVDYANSKNPDQPFKVFIAGDTRESSEWILQYCAAALESAGVEYASAGVFPTPAICFCFYNMGFDYAIDVTASHNPYTDNGIKIFECGEKYGIKLSEKGCEFIERAIANHAQLPEAAATLREDIHDEAVDWYTNEITYIADADLNQLHIGLDCANGAMSVIGGRTLTAFNAQVEVINHDTSYGQKINADCGSTHLEPLKDLVLKNHLDFGAAFDGDGDRCLLIDNTGEVVDGDQIIAILATHHHYDSIAVTVMSNQGLLNWAAKNQIKTEITPVGDTHVAIAMREKNIPIGGEQSGHVILFGRPTGDGLLTAQAVACVMAETGQSLHDLAQVFQKLPQVNLTLEADTNQKSALTSNDAVISMLAHFEEKVKAISGRLLVRPSGTENLIRLTVWGEDEAKTAALAEELKTKLGEIL